MRDSADFDDYRVTRRGKKRGKFHDDEATFLDRQGRVHARVSVDFPKEFGGYLSVPLQQRG